MPALANQRRLGAEDHFFVGGSPKKIFPGQPKVVANERDFYKTCRLADGDLQYLRIGFVVESIHTPYGPFLKAPSDINLTWRSI